MPNEKYNVIHKNVGPFRLTGYLELDQHAESPAEWGSGHLAHFTNGNVSNIIETYKDNQWAFPIGSYKHSNTMFFLQGEGPTCPFDTTSFCGYYCLDADTVNYIKTTEPDKIKQIEKAKQRVREELEVYTDWVNGDVYGAIVVSNTTSSTETHVEDTVYNIYGFESAVEELEQALKNAEQRFKSILNKRYRRFAELLKAVCNTVITASQYPGEYLGFYIPHKALSNRPVWVTGTSAEAVIKTINKKKGTLLHVFYLDTKENLPAKEIEFTTGYTLVS